MKGSKRKAFAAVLASGLVLAAAGCSGSGGGTTGAVVGLQTPSQVSVVTPVGGMAAPALADTSGFPAGSDWNRHSADVHVYDPAVEPLDLINRILCMMGQTRADAMVNQGPYNAQIDLAICAQGGGGGGDGSQAGQSSGDQAADFQIWVVDSLRPSSRSPQIVHVWVPEEDDGTEQTIFVDVTVEEGVTVASPFGRFHMNFAGVPDGGSVDMPQFRGHMATSSAGGGDVGFTFFEASGDVDQVPLPNEFARRVRVSMEMDAAQTSGRAHILSEHRHNFGGDSGIVSEDYLVAFDETHLLRSLNAAPETAYSRTDFRENVWRYNLYHAEGQAAGELVDLESGFGFRTEDDVYGWIGYHGLWLPSGADVQHGETVIRDVFGFNEEVPYTVFEAPGRLIHYSMDELLLTEIEGDEFHWWNDGDGMNYLVTYDMGLWAQVAVFDDVNGEWTELDPPVAIDTGALGYLGMWSDSLGGSVAWVHGADRVSFYSQEFVDGSHALFAGGDTVALQGFVNCLDSGITGAEAEAGDVFLPQAPDVNTPHHFEFQRGDLTLYRDADGPGGMGALARVGLADGEAPTDGPFTWGMSTGPLVTPADAALLVDVWDVWSLDEFYTWETGHNPWNRLVRVLDVNGDFVEFDAPLSLRYTHETANDRNDEATNDGRTYRLQYGGPGDLWGLPHAGVDLDQDGEDDRFYPVLSLKDAVLLEDAQGTGYAVKAIEVEQTLALEPGGAPGLSLLGANLALPDGSAYETPDIGPKPDVDEPPRVIDGEPVEIDE